MRIRRSVALVFALALIGVGAFWASSSVADTPENSFPDEGSTAVCPTHCGDIGCEGEVKLVELNGVGTFETFSSGGSPVVATVGEQSVKNGLKSVSFQLAAIDGTAFAEGVGETRFWLDASRPVPSALWQKKAGSEFPAVQEMRFHFFYTVEAMPGKVYRSINPAIMRSDHVASFPPPAGTVYRLMRPVQLEEIHEPGVVAGKVLANRVRMGGKGEIISARREQ